MFCYLSRTAHVDHSTVVWEYVYYCLCAQQFISPKLVNVSKFCIPYVTIDFVETQLKQFNTSKAIGYDNINARFLKRSASVIAPFLTHIFNCSIQSQTFPNAFNVAKVVPIYKKGDKCNTSNYRPISLLPFISLVFERHVNLHLKLYLENYNLLYGRQSGFRTNYSCQTASIRILDDWISAIDKNGIVGTLLIDLSNAFDIVNHYILLQKLELYGFHSSAVKWFSSYLSTASSIT